jgi:hypothetical protein
VAGDPAKVTWRRVDVVALGDDTARVTGRLQAGERVVALGVHLLHEGDAVRVERVARQVAAIPASVSTSAPASIPASASTSGAAR